MRAHEIESWARDVIDRVESGQPNEDFRVELKSVWPDDPNKAARRIAGHANAARGEDVLWLIGVDERQGVVGVDYADFLEWWDQVKAEFDEGFAPRVTDLNVPVDGKTVVALLFETDRAPFVIRNAVFGMQGGGPVSLEVPWREATAVRSARRVDLLRLLSPLQRLPSFEVLGGHVRLKSMGPQRGGTDPRVLWAADLELYVTPRSPGMVVIPFHRCHATLHTPSTLGSIQLEEMRLAPAYTSPITAAGSQSLSRTIENTPNEVLIHGPGVLHLQGAATTAEVQGGMQRDVRLAVRLLPCEAESPVPIEAVLEPVEARKNELARWSVRIPE